MSPDWPELTNGPSVTHKRTKLNTAASSSSGPGISAVPRWSGASSESRQTGVFRVLRIDALRAKRDRLQSALDSLARSGESQISLTDPDSRAMAAHTRVAVGYNAQIAIDAKNKLIVEQAVTNQVLDLGLLTQTAAPARDILGVNRIDVTADRGYFKFESTNTAFRNGRLFKHVYTQYRLTLNAMASLNTVTPQYR